MNTALKIAVVAIVQFTLCCCIARSERYLEKMEVHSNNIRLQPQNPETWKPLLAATSSGNFWERYYAYCFLSELLSDKITPSSDDAVAYLIRGIEDAEPEIRKRCVVGVKDLGGDAVNRCVNQLLNIVRQRKEDDVTWASADALAEVTSPESVLIVMKELLKVASFAPPEGTDPEAPQLRYFALESAKLLYLRHSGDSSVVQAFKALLATQDAAFSKAVRETLGELEKRGKH